MPMSTEEDTKDEPRKTRGSDFFGLLDFDEEDVEYFMEKYPKTFKKLSE